MVWANILVLHSIAAVLLVGDLVWGFGVDYRGLPCLSHSYEARCSEISRRRALWTVPRVQSRATFRLWEAPVAFAGTGQRQVDMNQYNLALDEIPEQWTANLLAKTLDRDEGVYLGVRDDRANFVDVVKVSFPRRRNEGMGLELQEIAGGREDGIGITLVAAVVKGMSADGCDILPGDAISRVDVVRKSVSSSQGLSQTENTVSVRTECLGYDATLDAIQTLPPMETDNETYELTIKRLRRKPKVKVNLLFPPSQGEPDTSIELFAGENLRLGMLVRGVKLNDPLAKRFDTKSGGNCGAGGLCRTCAVTVIRGQDLLSPQKVNEQQMLQDSPRWRLACKAFVGYGMKEGEITIEVNPRQWGSRRFI